MHREQMMAMDSNILLSWTNMKLRDEFDSLNSLCEEYEFQCSELESRLNAIGYKYNVNRNQFIWYEI